MARPKDSPGHSILSKVCHAYDVPIREVLSPSRRHRCTPARTAYTALMRHYGYDYTHIANMLNRSQVASARYWIMLHGDFMATNVRYALTYNTLLRTLWD